MRRWQAEWQGVDGDGRTAAGRATAQGAVAAQVVGVPFLAVRSGVPLHELIELVVGERGCAAVVRPTGHVAEGIIAAAVDRAAEIATRCAQGIETGQLVRVVVIAVEILVAACAVEWSLPELAQVRVGIAAAVARTTEPTRLVEGVTSTVP